MNAYLSCSIRKVTQKKKGEWRWGGDNKPWLENVLFRLVLQPTVNIDKEYKDR